MRGKIVVIILLLSLTKLNAQSTGLQEVINNFHDDTVLTDRLIAFARGGVEKSLNLADITIQQVIDTASSYLGTPHCMGGTTHRCIDCSGLLYATFRSLGVKGPRDSQDFARYGRIIADIDSLRRGDLVFFVGTYNTRKLITHSGIYLGDYKFIHTSASHGVIISDLRSNYWRSHYVFGTRIFTGKR